MPKANKDKLKHDKLKSFFLKELAKILDYEIHDFTVNLPALRFYFDISSDALTFDNLVKISEMAGSKDINIGARSEGGGPCTCDEYCYCTGPHSFVTLSVGFTNDKIAEILGAV